MPAWPAILESAHRSELAAVLLEYVRPRRWFRAKARRPSRARVLDLVPLGRDHVLTIVEITYGEIADGEIADGEIADREIAHAVGQGDLYAVPLAEVDERTARSRVAAGMIGAGAIIEALPTATAGCVIVDALVIPGYTAEALLDVIRSGRSISGEMRGELQGQAMPGCAELVGADLPAARIPRVEQTNSTATFGERVQLKIYRQLTAVPNPELEIGRFLTDHGEQGSAPRVVGSLSYRSPEGSTFSLGIAHEYLSNQGDAFSFVLGQLRDAFELVATVATDLAPPVPGRRAASSVGGGIDVFLADALDPATAAAVDPLLDRFVAMASRLGRRTGALHLVLGGAGPDQPDFVAEPLTATDRGRLAARVDAMLRDQLDALGEARQRLSPRARELADGLLTVTARQAISTILTQFRDRPFDVVKTRTHGDLHLGQVLVRGDDFVIIDFEGEPGRPAGERRAKSSPLRDVMGMVRSFDYAPEVLLREPSYLSRDQKRRAQLRAWSELWKQEMTAAYLRGYLRTTGHTPFVPRKRDDLALLLTFHQLEKVIYEIGYELNNRPAWVEIPLRGLAAMAGVERPS